MICDNCARNFKESNMIYDMKITNGRYLCYTCFIDCQSNNNKDVGIIENIKNFFYRISPINIG